MTLTKETVVTLLSHAHNCACARTYSSSHTRIHITYYTPQHTHYTLFIPYTYTNNTPHVVAPIVFYASNHLLISVLAKSRCSSILLTRISTCQALAVATLISYVILDQTWKVCQATSMFVVDLWFVTCVFVHCAFLYDSAKSLATLLALSFSLCTSTSHSCEGLRIASTLFLAFYDRLNQSYPAILPARQRRLMTFGSWYDPCVSCANHSDTSNMCANHSTNSQEVTNSRMTASSCAPGGSSGRPNAHRKSMCSKYVLFLWRLRTLKGRFQRDWAFHRVSEKENILFIIVCY